MGAAKDREEFCYLMGLENGSSNGASRTVTGAREIMRLATRHQRLCEAYCNGSIDEGAYEKRTDSLERTIQAVVAGFINASAVFQHDPRGATVKLQVPSGRTNDWGNIGICVPTR